MGRQPVESVSRNHTTWSVHFTDGEYARMFNCMPTRHAERERFFTVWWTLPDYNALYVDDEEG